MSHYDFVIVGAGVIGTSTAYHLKRLNHDARVLLLDREKRVGAGNTAKSTALYRNIFTSRISKNLATSSIAYYETVKDKVKLVQNGYLWTFSELQWKHLRSAVDSLDRAEDRIQFLSRNEIQQIFSLNTGSKSDFHAVDHGLLASRCGSLSPTALAGLYAGDFQNLGGDLKLGTHIQKIVLKGSEVLYSPWSSKKGIDYLLDDSQNQIGADSYVFATGAWTQELLGDIGIYSGTLPKKRQLFAIRLQNREDFLSDQQLRSAPVLILPSGGLHIKPILNRKLLVIGLAGDLGVPFRMTDSDADPVYFDRAVRPALAHYFPALGETEIQLLWAGYYSYHWPDKNPVVESEENIFWVSGTSGSGIMKADALGRIAAAKLLGRKTATLFDGESFAVDDLSLKKRNVDDEYFVI